MDFIKYTVHKKNYNKYKVLILEGTKRLQALIEGVLLVKLGEIRGKKLLIQKKQQTIWALIVILGKGFFLYPLKTEIDNKNQTYVVRML